MSRTYKDRPYKGRIKEAMRKGLIDHDHVNRHSRGNIEGQNLVVGFHGEMSEKRYFMQHEMPLFREWKEYFDAELIEYEVTVEDIKGTGKIYRGITVITPTFRRFKTKKVANSEYCTDHDHYAVSTIPGGRGVDVIDTRDGKIATCTPDVWHFYGSTSRKNKSLPIQGSGIRNNARMGAARIARAYNSGIEIDYFDDSDLYTENVEKGW